MPNTIAAILEKIAGWIIQAGDRIADMVARIGQPEPACNPVRAVEPKRLTIADQWDCLAGIVKSAAVRAEEAMQCHASAMVQLDLAQYALTSLVDELAGVMNVGGRQRRATVYVFDPAVPRRSREAIAA